MRIEYRRIQKKDTPLIVDILNQLFTGEWYRRITKDFLEEKVIENPYFSFEEAFVAVLRENIVGFGIHISRGEKIGYIHSLAVKKKYQNKGIGRELLERIERIARGRKEKELWIHFSTPANLYLGVDRKSKKTMNFFLHQGYKIREDHYSEGIYSLNLKSYQIPEEVQQREKKLEEERYRIAFSKYDKKVSNFCRKHGAYGWAESPAEYACVMKKNEKMVGFCGYSLKDVRRIAIIGKSGTEWGPFLVDPQERGRGIGTIIICRSLKEMSEKGYPSTILQSAGSQSEDSGPRIYRKLGFKLVKEWIQMYKIL